MTIVRPCLVVTSALFVLCCLVYPGVVTAGAQVLFKDQANGSLLTSDGKVVGSALIGQTVADWAAHPEYLWGRASAASNDAATNITYSSGSNYGPMNAAYLDEVKARVELLRKTGVNGAIPADLVTKSASGLDPHISPAAAALQAPRIASVRHLPESKVSELIAKRTEASTLGFMGEPRVNVLLVNLDLDAEAPYASSAKGAASGSPATAPLSQK